MMKFALKRLHWHIVTVLFAFLVMPLHTKGSNLEEVLLTMNQRNIGPLYVTGIYDSQTGETFLPVMELFGILEIYHQAGADGNSITGTFLKPENPFVIDFENNSITLGASARQLTAAEFRRGQTDYFITPAVFQELFAIEFTVNISHLILSMRSSHRLPFEERIERVSNRARRLDRLPIHEDLPLEFDRDRKFFTGAKLDYSLSAATTDQEQNFAYLITGGMEMLGGDIQGTVIGNMTNTGFQEFLPRNIRWRYAVRDNAFFSGFSAGQIFTTGLQPLTITGFSITNDPIEPRRLYETFVVDGHTDPESEVELYVNDRLVDYQRANELGYYRFDVPIIYGTSRISFRIFTPDGQLIVSDRQIQVPFTFLPTGVITYNIQAGQTDAFNTGIAANNWIAHGNIAAGIRPWLTVSGGMQHLGNTLQYDNLLYYGSASARIAQQYLVNLDAAPNHFYRLAGSVMYANMMNFSVMHTLFDGPGPFNARGALQEFAANVFLPFRMFGSSAGFRIGAEHSWRPSFQQVTSLNSDFNVRIGLANLRLNYRDNILLRQGIGFFPDGLASVSATVLIPRHTNWAVFRDLHIRAVSSYAVQRQRLHSAELFLSRNIVRDGRLQLGAVYYNFDRSFNGQLSFIWDLRRVRSTTNVQTGRTGTTARQTFTGSFGWDMPNRHIGMSNRHQAGKGSASVLMFIDKNNTGAFEPGDQLLPYSAVRLNHPSIKELGRDSILRISQLQSYHRYNLRISRLELGDPTLVPAKDNFSFITDPNQHKQLEIPFYRGGVVEGMVLIERDGVVKGQGGLRLNIRAEDNTIWKTIRNLTDGSYFIMDIPPGKYTIEVDSAQLQFLEVRQLTPGDFEIRALAEGDFIEGKDIMLVPLDWTPGEIADTVTDVAPVPDFILVQPVDTIQLQYRVQIANLRPNAANRARLAQLYNLNINDIREEYYRGNRIYTIGNFTSDYAQAALLRNRLMNENRIIDAFVVAFHYGKRNDSLFKEHTPYSEWLKYKPEILPVPASIEVIDPTITDTAAQEAESRIQLEYRVQIANLRPRAINRANLARIYRLDIDQIKEDPFTGRRIYTMRSFDNMEDALKFRNELIRNHRIMDAFVVGFKDGARNDSLFRIVHPGAVLRDVDLDDVGVNSGNLQPQRPAIEYRVQIANLRFHPDNLSNLVQTYNLRKEDIEEVIFRGRATYTMGRFTNRADAEALMQRLRTTHRISDAFIVIFRNGARNGR